MGSKGTSELTIEVHMSEVEARLDELDEQRWDALFAKSHDVLARLAAQAERDDQAGLTDELDPDHL